MTAADMLTIAAIDRHPIDGALRPVETPPQVPATDHTRTTPERPCGACEQGWPCARHDDEVAAS